jgi:hypothetical protein
LLVLAAAGLSRVSSDAVITSLIAAESMLDRLPDSEEIPARLAAAQIRLTLARRTGNFGLVLISLRGTPCRRENWGRVARRRRCFLWDCEPVG